MTTPDEPDKDPAFIPADDPRFVPYPDEPPMDASGPTDRNAPPQPDQTWPEGWDTDADED